MSVNAADTPHKTEYSEGVEKVFKSFTICGSFQDDIR